MEDLLEVIRANDLAPWLWPAILVLAAIYLIALGGMAILRPSTAVRFLSGFAQTTRANVAEAVVRSLIGLAIIGMAPVWQSLIAAGAGLFLIVTALAMLVFPQQHRRHATRSVSAVSGAIRYIGAASLAFGCALIALLAKTAY